MKFDIQTIFNKSRIAVLELRTSKGLSIVGAGEELAWRLAVAHKYPLTEVCRVTGRSEKDIKRDCASFSHRLLCAHPGATLTEQRRLFDQFNKEATTKELLNG